MTEVKPTSHAPSLGISPTCEGFQGSDVQKPRGSAASGSDQQSR